MLTNIKEFARFPNKPAIANYTGKRKEISVRSINQIGNKNEQVFNMNLNKSIKKYQDQILAILPFTKQLMNI